MRGMVFVVSPGIDDDASLRGWVSRPHLHARQPDEELEADEGEEGRREVTSARPTGEFTGFPLETFRFLMELSANNAKPWFDAHRGDYERYYLKPALAFIEAIGPRLQREVSADVQYEARVNGSLFRINRDVRFSTTRRPTRTTWT